MKVLRIVWGQPIVYSTVFMWALKLLGQPIVYSTVFVWALKLWGQTIVYSLVFMWDFPCKKLHFKMFSSNSCKMSSLTDWCNNATYSQMCAYC